MKSSFTQKTTKALKSRTIRTLAIMFAMTLVDVYGRSIDPSLLVIINGALATLAGYYHINPKVKFHAE